MATVVTGAGIDRIRVFVAKQALEMYVRTGGSMELTRGGAQAAVRIVEEITGKTYKRGIAGKRAALADVVAILDYDDDCY